MEGELMVSDVILMMLLLCAQIKKQELSE